MHVGLIGQSLFLGKVFKYLIIFVFKWERGVRMVKDIKIENVVASAARAIQIASDRILKKKVAWGITGSGDDIDEIMKVMKEANTRHGDVEVRVYVSKAGEQVLKMYSVFNDLQKHFTKVKVEKNSNTPFLVGEHIQEPWPLSPCSRH